MARQRVVGRAHARILNPLEILNYVVAAHGHDVEDPGVYAANRQQLLAKGLLGHCTAFWMHGARIPDELRPHADDDLDAEWAETDDSLSKRQVEARRLWLAAHPVAE